MSSWDTSNREALLQGLEAVIKQRMTGLKVVRRQALDKECLADTELPAILIDELSSSYTWEDRYGQQEMRLVTILVFDLQATCVRNKKDPLGDVAKAREALVAELLRTLKNNPTLKVKLDDEAEEMAHAIDAFHGAEVRYMKTKYPQVRALVTVRMLTSENFADEKEFIWTNLILNARPSADEDAESLTNTITLETKT